MNTTGTIFLVTLYGESHQPAIGVVIDGMVPGILIDTQKIAHDLALRNPQAIGTTDRKEPDRFEITSGLYNGITTGSPIHVMIRNENVVSKDYDHLKQHPRPGHADFVASIKYNHFHDPRGGGRFSGRLTAPLVVAGTIAKMMLPYTFSHTLIQIGTLKDMALLDQYLTQIKEEKDSVGGIIEVVVQGIPIGLGEPMFSKVESKIASMLFAMPAVKGVEFGTGFEGVHLKGSEFNDRFIDDQGTTATNHSGGISGGITNGNSLVVKVFIKPTSSIQQAQDTFDLKSQAMQSLSIGGRHDVCIARRAGIVIENGIAIVLADLFLLAKATQSKDSMS